MTTVQRSKGHQTMTCVGDVHGSRAYSARRFAQVRPTAHLLLTGKTLLGRMTVYQRDRVFAWFYSENIDEHHPKIAHNKHERKTINTVHGFSKLAWNSCGKGPAKTVQTNTIFIQSCGLTVLSSPASPSCVNTVIKVTNHNVPYNYRSWRVWCSELLHCLVRGSPQSSEHRSCETSFSSTWEFCPTWRIR